MDEQLGEMTDDQVMAEWEKTHVDNLDLAPRKSHPPTPMSTRSATAPPTRS